MTEQVEEKKIDSWTKLISQPSLMSAKFERKRKYRFFGPVTEIVLHCVVRNHKEEAYMKKSIILKPSDTLETIGEIKDSIIKAVLRDVLAWQNTHGY